MLDSAAAAAIAHLRKSRSARKRMHWNIAGSAAAVPAKRIDRFHAAAAGVGMATAEEVAEVLETVWGGEETLIVISSDFRTTALRHRTTRG